MLRIVYLLPYILCPWPGCGFQIELLDLQLEKSADPNLYAQVMNSWGQDPDFGVIARCPGCRNYVFFGLSQKKKSGRPCRGDRPDLTRRLAFARIYWLATDKLVSHRPTLFPLFANPSAIDMDLVGSPYHRVQVCVRWKF